MATKKIKREEYKKKRGGTTFFPMRHDVLRSPVYQNLSGNALKLFWCLASQYTGSNNGNLSATFGSTGFKSPTTLNKAKKELLKSELVIVSRQGGRHKCTLYALSFFAIDDCRDMDIFPTVRPPDNWKRQAGAKPIKPPD